MPASLTSNNYCEKVEGSSSAEQDTLYLNPEGHCEAINYAIKQYQEAQLY